MNKYTHISDIILDSIMKKIMDASTIQIGMHERDTPLTI